MYRHLADSLRVLAIKINPEGDVTKKHLKVPKIKPPRRRSPGQNKTNRSDYFQKYLKKYREDGKDYQKVPDGVKQWRKEHKKRLQEKEPLKAHLLDQELDFWGKTGTTVDPDEFEIICSRRGFDEDDRVFLAEELYERGLIGTSELEEPLKVGYRGLDSKDGRLHPDYIQDHTNCPVCGKQYEMTCRCLIGDKTCQIGRAHV